MSRLVLLVAALAVLASLVAAFGVNDAVGMQPGAGQCGGEQVAPAQAPQDRSVEVRKHASDLRIHRP